MALTRKNSRSGVPALFTEYAPADRAEKPELMRQYELWAKQEHTRLIGDAVPNLVLILNKNRQIVFANSKISLYGKY